MNFAEDLVAPVVSGLILVAVLLALEGLLEFANLFNDQGDGGIIGQCKCFAKVWGNLGTLSLYVQISQLFN